MPAFDVVKQTPLYSTHLALGARMMAFAGFDMPVQYSGIVDEHMAVRRAAGLFDVSHMGEIFVRGSQAFDFVQNLATNDVGRLYDGRALYTVMCNENGGIVDDLLVYRLSEREFMLVINASNIEKDFSWMQAHNPMGAELVNASDSIALLAVQGPRSIEIVQALTDQSLSDLQYYHFLRMPPGSFFGCAFAILSRTGYTGEPGIEIYCDPDKASGIWKALMEEGSSLGLKPVGLGARDTLRLEAGFCLYGNDLTEETNPLEAGLGWVTKLDKGEFVGSDALRSIRGSGTNRKLIGFVLNDRGIPRHGYPIVSDNGTEIGVVTSGAPSPILGKGIGLGYVTNEDAYTQPGRSVGISVRGKPLPATVEKPPFHKK